MKKGKASHEIRKKNMKSGIGKIEKESHVFREFPKIPEFQRGSSLEFSSAPPRLRGGLNWKRSGS
jgi:hypothetical protein